MGKGKALTYSVKSVVDKMFDIFTHSNLSHQFILVSVHASELTDVGEHILYPISQLKGVYITEPEMGKMQFQTLVQYLKVIYTILPKCSNSFFEF